MSAATADELALVAEVTCRPGSHVYNLRTPFDTVELVRVLDSLRA